MNFNQQLINARRQRLGGRIVPQQNLLVQSEPQMTFTQKLAQSRRTGMLTGQPESYELAQGMPAGTSATARAASRKSLQLQQEHEDKMAALEAEAAKISEPIVYNYGGGGGRSDEPEPQPEPASPWMPKNREFWSGDVGQQYPYMTKENARDVVREMYQKLLGREPESEDVINAWADNLMSHKTPGLLERNLILTGEYEQRARALEKQFDIPENVPYDVLTRWNEGTVNKDWEWAGKIKKDRTNEEVLRERYGDDKFQYYGNWVKKAYQTWLGREPDPEGWQYFTDALVFGGANWQDVAANILFSGESLQRRPQGGAGWTLNVGRANWNRTLDPDAWFWFY